MDESMDDERSMDEDEKKKAIEFYISKLQNLQTVALSAKPDGAEC